MFCRRTLMRVKLSAKDLKVASDLFPIYCNQTRFVFESRSYSNGNETREDDHDESKSTNNSDELCKLLKNLDEKGIQFNSFRVYDTPNQNEVVGWAKFVLRITLMIPHAYLLELLTKHRFVVLGYGKSDYRYLRIEYGCDGVNGSDVDIADLNHDKDTYEIYEETHVALKPSSAERFILKKRWRKEKYHVFTNNCRDFAYHLRSCMMKEKELYIEFDDEN